MKIKNTVIFMTLLTSGLSLLYFSLVEQYETLDGAALLFTKSKGAKTATIKRNIAQVPTAKNKSTFYLSKSTKLDAKNIKDIEQCYKENNKCNFAKTDPKSEYFAIGQKIKKELLKVVFLSRENNTQSEELSELSRHFLKSSDGHVKEAALHLMSTQEVDIENLKSILAYIIDYHDAKLIQHAMLEISRYMGNSEAETLIHPALDKAIRNGAPYVSQELTKYMLDFINATSLSIYKGTLSRVSRGSLSHTHLKTAIQEFKRLQDAA